MRIESIIMDKELLLEEKELESSLCIKFSYDI